MSETEIPSIVFQVAYGLVFLLLLAVTGGIGYLTISDWRERRRRSREGKPSPAKRPTDKRKRK